MIVRLIAFFPDRGFSQTDVDEFNSHDLIVNAEVSIVSGTAERDTALTLLSELPWTTSISVPMDSNDVMLIKIEPVK